MNFTKVFLYVVGLLAVLGGLYALVAALGAKPSVVEIVMTDHSLMVVKGVVPAGKVRFTIVNTGQMEHELIVLKTDLAPSALHMELTGQQVDEDSSGQSVGEAEGIAPGKMKQLSLTLKPGRYVLLCNLPEHYRRGIYAGFVVN